MPACKKCLKRIGWKKSVMGKMIPIEEDKYLTCIPDKDGDTVIITDDGWIITGFRVSSDYEGECKSGYLCHFNC